jgi:hypothetical protein
VVVTTPQAVSISDVRKEINFCAKTNIPVLGIIENMSGYSCPCCGEISNVFSKGGGQVMATDMGVPFLGSVPIDTTFGALVESQKLDGDTDSLGDGDIDMEEAEAERHQLGSPPAVDDDRPLVEKYKNCWSSRIFEGLTKELLGKIETIS